MTIYRNEVLGSFFSNNKDFVLPAQDYGTTIDLYLEPLVGGVTYSIGAFGVTERGGTMLNPALVVYDVSGQNPIFQYDGLASSPSLEEQNRDPFWLLRGPRPLSPDPLLSFTAPVSGTYFVGVFDETGALGNSYSLLIEGAGVPIFFGASADLAGAEGTSAPSFDFISPSNSSVTNPNVGNTNPLPIVNSGSTLSPVVNSSNINKDLLVGTAANEKLVGGNTNDRLFGNDGNDTLIGGRGNDTLFGGSGNNILVGGKGHDVFALEQSSGKSTVKDFQKRQDKLGLPLDLGFKNLKVEQRNNNTLISSGKDQLMLLVGVQNNQIRAADFTQI